MVRDPDGGIRLDLSGHAPGRGAYLHRRGECIERAIGKGGLAHALRTPLPQAEAASLIKDLMARVEETH